MAGKQSATTLQLASARPQPSFSLGMDALPRPGRGASPVAFLVRALLASQQDGPWRSSQGHLIE